MSQIEIENVEMKSEVVENDVVSDENLLKEIADKMAKLSLTDMQKCMVKLVQLMSKPIKDADKAFKKAENTPKRKSTHLSLHRDWAAYVLVDAKANGWPSFHVTITKKDKSTEDKIFSESVKLGEDFVFADTASKEKPTKMSSATAAQLAKFYKVERPAMYADFLASRPAEEESKSDSESASASSSTTSSPKKVKLTDAEKQAKKDAEKAKKDAEKVKKETDRLAAKAKKEAEERIKLEAKLAAIGKPKPKSPKKSEIPAAAVAAVAASPAVSATVSTESPKPVARKVVAKKSKEEFKDDFVASDPTGENFDDWVYTDAMGNAKMYLRNAMNEIADPETLAAIGTYDPKTNKITLDE